NYDFVLLATAGTGGVNLSFEYNANAYAREMVERIGGHFIRAAEAVVADPRQRISQIDLLSESEKHQLLQEFNDTEAEYPQDKCLHELFEEQAARFAGNVAVVY